MMRCPDSRPEGTIETPESGRSVCAAAGRGAGRLADRAARGPGAWPMTEETLFAAALERTLATERQAFLDEACAGEVTLRRRVARLLAAHEKPRGILDRPDGPGAPDDDGRPVVCVV